MARSAEALCGLLGSAAGSGQQVDIWKSLQSLTLDVVGTVAFGVDFNTLASPEANGQTAGDGKPDAIDAEGKAGGRARSLRSASTDALLSAVRTVFEVCGPAQPLFGLCFIFPEVRSCAACCLCVLCDVVHCWIVLTWPKVARCKAMFGWAGLGAELLARCTGALAESYNACHAKPALPCNTWALPCSAPRCFTQAEPLIRWLINRRPNSIFRRVGGLLLKSSWLLLWRQLAHVVGGCISFKEGTYL